MPLSAIERPYYKSDLDRYEQGDILRDVTIVEWAEEEGASTVSVKKRTLQYCIVVSQECDLEHDYDNRAKSESPTNDKFLQSLLICPAYGSQSFKNGDHLQGAGLKMQHIDSKAWGRIRQNNNSRYHYLQPWPDLQVQELVVDFKHYITVPRDVLYREQYIQSYVASMEIMYRDSLSTRFAHYLSRIGLPELTSA